MTGPTIASPLTLGHRPLGAGCHLDGGRGIGKPAPMFPIRDHNPSGRTPHVTRMLIGLNVGIFLSYWFGLGSDLAVARFFLAWGVVPARLAAGEGYATLLTSMFLHGGWMHLLGNMLFLHVFGDNLEDRLGHGRFLGFYLGAGLAAALAQMAADPGSTVPMVGASGAIAGVLGGYLLLYPRARVDVLFILFVFFKVVPIPAWIVLGVWFALQVLSGATTPTDAGGVAYWAHVGGFVAGLALAFPAFFAAGGPAFWRITQGAPPHPAAVYAPGRLPRVVRRRDRGPWDG